MSEIRERILELLNSDNYEDRLLGCIIMGKQGKKLCLSIIQTKWRKNVFFYNLNYTKIDSGYLIFNNFHLFLGSGGILYYGKGEDTVGTNRILYDGTTEE